MTMLEASSPRPRVLVVDDDPIACESLAAFLTSESFDALGASSALEALDLLERAEDPSSNPFSCVISDLAMPQMDGLALLREVRQRFPDVVVVMVTGYGTIESAVEAIRQGAVDYLAKPLVDSELRLTLAKAMRQQALLAENTRLKRRLDERPGIERVIGANHRMMKALDLIDRVAATKATVLMTGESGTGKSLIARAIHDRSARSEAPFVEIHCGSVPETLLESELFGHVKGAFTGASLDKAGRFLAANGGTIFIDEINSASPALQLKLLRVLQERAFEPVGSSQTIEVDVRVVLASNQPLEDLVAQGRFREDLYYRINVVRIDLPPVRERASDVPALVHHFLEELSLEHARTITGLTDEAMAALARYPFPGNVRELRNIIERAVVLARRPTLGIEDLPEHVVAGVDALGLPGIANALDDEREDASTWAPMPLARALEDPEKRILLRALRANNWNRQKTADDLNINRTTLYKKIKAYGLDALAG